MSQLSEEILKRIDALAAKLGTTAEYLWGVLVRQGKLQGWVGLVEEVMWVLAVPLLAWATLKLAKMANQAADEHDDNAVCYGVGAVITAIASLIAFLGAVMDPLGWVTPMFNPEYWALKQIIG